MSRNVEVVRAVYTGFDLTGLRPGADPCVASLFDPSFELRPPDESPDRQTYRGFDGLVAYLRMMADVYEEGSYEAERLLEAGDRVVVLGRATVRGKGSGVPVTIHSAHVWTVRAGRLASMQIYADQTAALDVVGLKG